MLWIKRNLFLAAGGLLAFLLLAAGLYYFWTSRQKNTEIETKLEENKTLLRNLVSGNNPYPSATNITRAREEIVKVRAAITNARSFFHPVPYEPVTGLAFKSLLDSNIFELHRKADDASVILPGKNYAFTFEYQKRQLQFPPEAFPALPQQLAEIKTICEILFRAKVNKLTLLRRSRLYADEPVSQVDHHDMKPTFDEAMGMAANPYEVVFHAFSTELATVLESFYKSTNGLIVKSIQVDIAPAATPDPTQPVMQPRLPQPAPVPQQPQPQRPVVPGALAKPPEGIRTVLNEKLLRISLLLDVVRALPPKTVGGPKEVTWNR